MASPCSLGNRRARRGLVSQNITHTAVGFMSKQWRALFLPPSPPHLLSLTVVVHLSASCSRHSGAILCSNHPKKTTIYSTRPSLCLLHLPPPSLLSLRNETRTCTPSFISLEEEEEDSTRTQMQSYTQAENSIKSPDTDSAWYCFE